MRWLIAAAAAGSVLLGLPTTASKLTPPVVPLAIRNPYLSTWLGDVRETPWSKWPMFWTGEEVKLPLTGCIVLFSGQRAILLDE